MKTFPFTRGLHQITPSIYAYIQPDGSWGWNNAGIICDKNESFLVDTLYDLTLTQTMLDAMRDATPAADNITHVINTHANGDHTYGNQLIPDAEIVSSAVSSLEMDELPPQMMAQLIVNADAMGPIGAYMKSFFGVFDFEGIELVRPTFTFDEEITLFCGSKEVILKDLGPAHTKSDVIVIVPEDKVAFTGDLLFNGSTPVIWAGPVQNWIDACDTIMEMDIDYLIPGHGPIAEKSAILQMKDYWEYLCDQAKDRYDKGMPAMQAAADIDLGKFAQWSDPERIVINIHALYQEFSGAPHGLTPVQLFGMMAQHS